MPDDGITHLKEVNSAPACRKGFASADRFNSGPALYWRIKMGRAEIVHCNDCQSFVVIDWSADTPEGFSILLANQVPTCIAWGGGCKTIRNGYCHLAKRKIENDQLPGQLEMNFDELGGQDAENVPER